MSPVSGRYPAKEAVVGFWQIPKQTRWPQEELQIDIRGRNVAIKCAHHRAHNGAGLGIGTAHRVEHLNILVGIEPSL